MAAISDSSPLILYAAIDRLTLLHDLYDEVIVPPAVWDEIVVGGAGRAGAAAVAASGWIRRRPIPAGPTGVPFPSLHRGEAEVIALARFSPPTASVILDDLPARRVAERLGFSVTGSVGVLLLAKRTGLIPAVGPLLGQLRDTGLRLSETVVARSLALAGEA